MQNTFFKKILLSGFLSIIIFILFFQLTFAEGPLKFVWEVSLPGFDPDKIDGLGSLVRVIIRWSYWLAVLFAFYKLVETGFKYMTSKGNANIVAFAGKSLQNILIGLLILFGSYLILNTINKDLVSLPNISSSNRIPFGTSPSWKERTTWSHNLNSGVQWTTLFAINSAWKNTPDSRNAASDLADGKASATIENIIVYMLDNRDLWLGENCSNSVEFGPIVTGHFSDPNHPANSTYVGRNGKSCHQTGHAVDLVIFQKNAPNSPSVSCMKTARAWLLNNFSDKIKVCDETNISGVTPHIHIEDINCPIGPSC